MSEIRTNRKKTRKFLFQELYCSCFSDFVEELFIESFFDWTFNFKKDKEYLDEMKEIIIKNEFYFLELIKKYAPKFNVENMNLTYIIPVYISLAEMLYLKEEVPARVSINEAVELAKMYGDDSSKKIVNWILNKVFENIEEIQEKIKTTEKKEYVSIFK